MRAKSQHQSYGCQKLANFRVIIIFNILIYIVALLSAVPAKKVYITTLIWYNDTNCQVWIRGVENNCFHNFSSFIKYYDIKYSMVRPVEHSISTPFWANWDQSNPYDTIYLAIHNNKAVS